MDESRLSELYEQLAATGERPVERTASRWLGEAEAIAGDVAQSDLDPDVRRERLAKVRELLDHVETTGDKRADEHVEAAREILDELQDEA
jgi:DNA-binding transcriptional regulator YdaS (Cro superfamily)